MRTDFVSADGSSRWDVFIDDEATCTTPCTKWVDPNRAIRLHTRQGFKSEVHVERLDNTQGPMQVAARKTSLPKLATGLTFVSLGGMAMIAGIALPSVGCSDDEKKDMCKAGLISGGAGLLVVIPSIFIILDALPKVHVRPIFGGPDAEVSLGPTGVYGRF